MTPKGILAGHDGSPDADQAFEGLRRRAGDAHAACSVLVARQR